MSEQTKGYRELIAWQKALDLVPEVYRLARRLPAQERWGLADQMRRAVISVGANLAEGHGRRSPREFGRFATMARGSLAELDTLLEAGMRLGYWQREGLMTVTDQVIDVRRLIQGLIARLQQR